MENASTEFFIIYWLIACLFFFPLSLPVHFANYFSGNHFILPFTRTLPPLGKNVVVWWNVGLIRAKLLERSSHWSAGPAPPYNLINLVQYEGSDVAMRNSTRLASQRFFSSNRIGTRMTAFIISFLPLPPPPLQALHHQRDQATEASLPAHWGTASHDCDLKVKSVCPLG